MNRIAGSLLFLLAQAIICMPHAVFSATTPADLARPEPAAWKSSIVHHAYGLPGAKPKEKGTLTVNSEGLTFTGKSGGSSIQRPSVIAVSAGNERVELWGMKGRLLRMAIPENGGLAVAAILHHRVDMLTVEFSDNKGGYHGAVFLLPAHEAERALASFAQMPEVQREAASATCEGTSVRPGSVLISAPTWDQIHVPAAYRALVYERLIDRTQHLKGSGYVYRDGEDDGQMGCPQYVIHTSIAGFKQGSQVKRAVLGPAGMFVGTTQMTFDATFTDASGKLDSHQQIKATVRGETESTSVADTVAKSLAKHYSSVKKEFEKTNVAAAAAVSR